MSHVSPAVREALHHLYRSPTLYNESDTLSAVHLVSSPFPGRRATLVFRPADRACDGSPFCEATEEVQQRPLVVPAPLPVRIEMGSSTGGNEEEESLGKTISRRKGGPYSRLSYTMDDACVSFTAVLATLEAAGFSCVRGRAALLHNTFSLKWIKHLLPRDVKAAAQQASKFQKINHFPATHVLGRKDKLHRQLQVGQRRWQQSSTNAEKKGTEWKDFVPQGWILPDEEVAFWAMMSASSKQDVFIAKPVNQAGGQGIFLFHGGVDVAGSQKLRERLFLVNTPAPSLGGSGSSLSLGTKNLDTSFIVQRYVERPFLVLGRKFDLRLYVVITSYAPFRMYLYKEGLVRIATSAYTAQDEKKTSSLSDLTAHLTNFTVNKSKETREEEAQHAREEIERVPKWGLGALEVYMKEQRVDWDATQERIHDLLRKAFLSAAVEVRQELVGADSVQPLPCSFRGISPFFEIYGVDVLLQSPSLSSSSSVSQTVLQPVLMEINIMPSLSTHYSLLDQCIKSNFVADTLTLVGLTSPLFKSPGNEKSAAPQADKDALSAPDAVTQFVQEHYKGDETLRDLCWTAEEERLRSPRFHRLCPTPTSAQTYSSLLVGDFVDEKKESGRVQSLILYDQVLSAWETHRKQ